MSVEIASGVAPDDAAAQLVAQLAAFIKKCCPALLRLGVRDEGEGEG